MHPQKDRSSQVRRLGILGCLATVGIGFGVPCVLAEDDDPVPLATIQAIRAAVENCDAEEISTFNGRIFRSSRAVASSALTYLSDVWSSANDSECLSNSENRTHVAVTLAEGYDNRLVNVVDLSSVRQVLREGVGSTNESEAFMAIAGLSKIAEPMDLKMFEDQARTALGSRRIGLIQALSIQCSADATDAIDRLSQLKNGSDVKKIRGDILFIRNARCQRSQTKNEQCVLDAETEPNST